MDRVIKRFEVDPAKPDPALLEEVMARLRGGEVGVLPTETVYGLAAAANQKAAVERIYRMKGRDFQKPCALAIGRLEVLNYLVSEVSETAQELIENFWPGALTLVLHATDRVPGYLLRGGTTVGLRMPDHEFLSPLLQRLEEPLVLTSANISGQKSPRTVEKVDVGPVEFVVDGGPADLGRESTVVDVTVDPPHILRQGAIDANRLWEFGVTS